MILVEKNHHYELSNHSERLRLIQDVRTYFDNNPGIQRFYCEINGCRGYILNPSR